MSPGFEAKSLVLLDIENPPPPYTGGGGRIAWRAFPARLRPYWAKSLAWWELPVFRVLRAVARGAPPVWEPGQVLLRS